MNDTMKKILGINWKTNLIAAVSFLLSVPSLVGAINNWAHHQPADWRIAIVGIVTAAGLAVSKDSTTSSTQAQVAASTIQNPAVEARAVVDAKVAAIEAPIPPTT